MLYISTEKLFFKGVYIYGDTGSIFKHKGPICNRRELQANSTPNTFQRKYENFD